MTDAPLWLVIAIPAALCLLYALGALTERWLARRWQRD